MLVLIYFMFIIFFLFFFCGWREKGWGWIEHLDSKVPSEVLSRITLSTSDFVIFNIVEW
jgi:hypothetical protein